MFKSGHGLEGLFKLTLTNRDAILHCRLLLATSRDLVKFWEKSDSISETAQDKDIIAMVTIYH